MLAKALILRHPLGFINLMSFFLMLFVFPYIHFINVFWLSLPTLFFLYHRQYKKIFFIWGFLILSWYCVFARCLAGVDSTWIGGIKTVRLQFHFQLEYSPLDHWYCAPIQRFCLESLHLLHLFSEYLGFPIYIPSIFKGLLVVCHFILGRS